MRKKLTRIKTLRSVSEIPTFRDEAEEAEFWQTHSPVEIFDELPKAKDVKFAPSRKKRAARKGQGRQS